MGDVRAKLSASGGEKALIIKLIVQGLLKLLEPEVGICCRDKDASLVQSAFAEAAAQYSQVIKAQTGASKSVKLFVDKSASLPATCLGGVVLTCQGGLIKIDNTLDLRLNLVMEQDKPAIRKLLLPSS